MGDLMTVVTLMIKILLVQECPQTVTIQIRDLTKLSPLPH